MRAALARLRTRGQARRIRTSGDDPRLAAVADALTWRPSEEKERKWLERIETERRRLQASDTVLRTPLQDYSLDPAHEHVFEDRAGDLCARASNPPQVGRFLFALLRATRPARAVELGTALGISTAYQAAALSLNGGGARMVTIEASRARLALARELLERLDLLGVAEPRLGRFQDVLPDLVRHPIGYAFVDGHHDEQATLDYAELIVPALAPPAVVVFDDISWSEGMIRAWRMIRADDRVAAHAETLGMGVCLYHHASRRGSSVGRAHD